MRNDKALANAVANNQVRGQRFQARMLSRLSWHVRVQASLQTFVTVCSSSTPAAGCCTAPGGAWF